MRAVRDARCPACGYEVENIYAHEEHMPACPECGTVLVTSWHSGQAPGLETLLVFKPLQVQGVTLRSKVEAAAFLKKANRRLGPHVGRIELVPDSPAERNVRVDEARHENYVNLKNHGVSPQDVAERRGEVAVKKQEKADAHHA